MYKSIFSFRFIEALDLKLIFNTLRKVFHQPWNTLMLQVSLSLRDKKTLRFLCKFMPAEATVINLFALLRVFLGGFRQLKRVQ